MENCDKLDSCIKIRMILDKEMLDFQYKEVVRSVCSKCQNKIKGG